MMSIYEIFYFDLKVIQEEFKKKSRKKNMSKNHRHVMMKFMFQKSRIPTDFLGIHMP